MLQLRLLLSPHPFFSLPLAMTFERQRGGISKEKQDKAQGNQVEAPSVPSQWRHRMCLTVSTTVTQGNMCKVVLIRKVGSTLSVQHFY